MAAGGTQKIKMRWNQVYFGQFMKWLPSPRRKKDQDCLKEAFNQVAQVPIFKQALAWAEAHGVKFFIDRTCVDVGGYYTPGSGVVAIAEKCTHSMQDFVRVIVHEIRHAWQDHHGLLKRSPYDFAGYLIKNSLIEADAYAFERRAADEFEVARLNGLCRDEEQQRSLSTLQESLSNKESYLAGKFLDWFSSNRTQIYGDAASKFCGRLTGAYRGAMAGNSCEFRSRTFALAPGLDISNSQNILKLGKTFSGYNYLAQLPPDVLPKKILRPSLALSFYGAANDEQRQLTADIRKLELRRWSKVRLARIKRGLPRFMQ